MPTTVNYGIRDVWKDNMEDEFANIRDIVEDYPFVAMVKTFILILLVGS
jgi:CCR4-NOT transcription complex subunit 7/8